ncbi:MAG: efflux RND transporter permease subunit [Candidatus Levybacteria bacterium]|nr:efflux RND transporter permease subunit [Candidatus Levybacteria bacterium]
MAETSYLKSLKFDPKLQHSFVARYLANPRLLILLTLSVVAFGIASFFGLPRRLNPEIKIPIVLVSTVLPGANPSDVESLVTIPIEDQVTGLSKVKTVQSSSRDSVSIINIEFESGVDPEKARTDVQSAVDSVNNLPDDAQTPKIIKLDFENQPVWTFSLTNDGDTGSLMRYARRLKDTIKDLPSIENVETSGLDEQEIQIVLKPQAIATYGVNPQQLAQLVTSSLGSYPAGVVRTEKSSFSLSIDPAVTTVDDFRNLRIDLNGTIVPLSEIATVTEQSKPDQQISYFAKPNASPQKAVTFYVFKTASANIDKAVEEAQKKTAESIKEAPQFHTSTISNTGEEIDTQFGELVRDFWITIVLIVIVLFVFLGLRQALVAAISAPLTFLISFTVMQMTGISLNFLSMFSLLLSLGLLVDDTIVVISAMTQYHRTGKFTPLQTGLLVWRDFVVAVFTTTITTVWAFLPLLLSTGIIGEFIKSIPIVVSTTLLASFAVAMFLTMPFIIIILRPNVPYRVVILLRVLFFLLLVGVFFAVAPKGPILILEIAAFVLFMIVTSTIRMQLVRKTKEYYVQQTRKSKQIRQAPKYLSDGIVHFSRIENKYRSILDRILSSKANRRKAIAMVLIFSVFSYLLLPLGFVKNEFFPKSDNDFIYVGLELPAGTNLTESDKEGKKVLTELARVPNLEFATAELGRTISQESGGSAGSESNNVLFTMKLLEKRSKSSIDIAQDIRNAYADYSIGKLNVIEISGGPPAGADVQVNLFGDDLQTLDSYANKTQEFLKTQQGVTNIDKSIKPGTSKLVFVPDKQKLASNGLTQDALGFWLRFYASGFSPDTVKLATDANIEKDVTLRMSKATAYPESLHSITIPTRDKPVQLMSLGTVHLAPNPTLITREDGKRTIAVTAGVTGGNSVSEVNQKLTDFVNTNLALPQGYTWRTGGVNEENQNSVNSILQAMLLSFLLIVLTMVLQFSSFRKALIVMLVIPLSISGVFILFALTRTPLSFPALIGVLALFGIVVKNAILVVDKIKKNIDHGMEFKHAIIDGSGSRIEAISLTSVGTIVGLIPITLSDPLWRGLGGAIIAGLAFSGSIMLFFIPIVYYYLFHASEGRRQS